jgi:hypothetical protein
VTMTAHQSKTVHLLAASRPRGGTIRFSLALRGAFRTPWYHRPSSRGRHGTHRLPEARTPLVLNEAPLRNAAVCPALGCRQAAKVAIAAGPGSRYSPTGMRISSAAVMLVVGVSAVQAAAPVPARQLIAVRHETLTVRLDKAPLTKVLEEISQQTGARIRGQVRNPQEVTAEFDNVPFPEAFHRLLDDQNFELIYSNGGKLRAVTLLSGPLSPPSPSVPTRDAVQSVARASESLSDVLAAPDTIQLGERLADILGSPTASVQQLLGLGLTNADAGIRAEAMRTLVSKLDEDQKLRSVVVGQLNAIDDSVLASQLRDAAGDHAAALARQIFVDAQSTEVRVKALSVLHQLRAAPSGT